MNERRCEQVGQVGERQAQDIDAPREGAQATFCFNDEREKARQVCSVCSNHAATGLKRGDACDCGRRFWERYNGRNEWRSQAAFERACLRRKTYAAKYGKRNRQKLTASVRKWSAMNPEKEAARKKKYYEKNKAKCIATIKSWGVKNRERVNAAARKRAQIFANSNPDAFRAKNAEAWKRRMERLRKNPELYEAFRRRVNKLRAENRAKRAALNPSVRIAENYRARVNSGLKSKKAQKGNKTQDLLGCSFEFLKFWLESKWKPGMSWENYGPKGWHIDHIRPCCGFDLEKTEQQRMCFHFLNLQPLWAHENLSKSGRQ